MAAPKEQIEDLIPCQVIVGELGDPLRPNTDFSNVTTVYVNENTMVVYDDDYQYIGIAEPEIGSMMFTIKLNG